MKHYWCFLCVRFPFPRLVRISGKDEVLRVDGYMRRLGVTVNTGTELRREMKKCVRDGRINWRSSEIERIRRTDLSAGAANGVWYRGGPLYFT